MEPQISSSVLFTAFLGLTEKQIDSSNPFGNNLQKIDKRDLDANMQIILYMLSQEQYFELIIDKDQDNIVVGQKTYWPNLNYWYNHLKEKAIVGLKCGYSDGFYVNAPQFGQILCEICALPESPRCILTSIP